MNLALSALLVLTQDHDTAEGVLGWLIIFTVIWLIARRSTTASQRTEPQPAEPQPAIDPTGARLEWFMMRVAVPIACLLAVLMVLGVFGPRA